MNLNLPCLYFLEEDTQRGSATMGCSRLPTWTTSENLNANSVFSGLSPRSATPDTLDPGPSSLCLTKLFDDSVAEVVPRRVCVRVRMCTCVHAHACAQCVVVDEDGGLQNKTINSSHLACAFKKKTAPPSFDSGLGPLLTSANVMRTRGVGNAHASRLSLLLLLGILSCLCE